MRDEVEFTNLDIGTETLNRRQFRRLGNWSERGVMKTKNRTKGQNL